MLKAGLNLSQHVAPWVFFSLLQNYFFKKLNIFSDAQAPEIPRFELRKAPRGDPGDPHPGGAARHPRRGRQGVLERRRPRRRGDLRLHPRARRDRQEPAGFGGGPAPRFSKK